MSAKLRDETRLVERMGDVRQVGFGVVETGIVQAGGISMDYVVAGAAEARPVLLIHGLGWDAGRLWAGVLPALAEAGFRAYAPNLRGVGGTEATDAAYTTDLYARDLEAFLDAFGIDRLPVVGFSMGASIAGALVARSSRVSALTLACGGLHGTEAGRRGVEDMLARAEKLGPSAFAAEQAEAIFRPAWAAANPAAVEDFRTWRAAMNQDALFRAFRSGYGADFRAAVRGAGVPTQVIAADTDAFCELDDMRAMAEAIPGARFDVIGACGHMATIEQLEVFNRVLVGFLQDEVPA
jgi:pimeloyl-ACP methyl ester carboxylesterase